MPKELKMNTACVPLTQKRLKQQSAPLGVQPSLVLLASCSWSVE